MKVGVTGASGFIGQNLIPELTKNGYQVKILLRNASKKVPFENVERVEGDFSNSEKIEEFVKDLDYLIHCAGVIKAFSPEDFIKGNYNSTKSIVDALNKVKPANFKKFIFLSSQSAQGPSKELIPRRVDQPPEPVSWYGKSKLMAENYIINHLESPYIILRLASVYGPGDKETLRFFKLAKTGILPMPNGEKYINIIYVKDVVNLILKLLEKGEIANKIYFVANPEYITLTNLIEGIQSFYGKKSLLKISIPEFVFRPLLKLNEIFGKLLRKPTIANSDKANELSQKYWIGDPSPLYEETGFKPQYSLLEGLYESLEWYKQNKWL